jgi:hypothetical protein
LASHDLEKVDTIRARIDASYAEVRDALDAADGDVLGALVCIEQKRAAEVHPLTAAATQLVGEIKEVASGGIGRLDIKLDNLVIAQLPVTLTGLAAALVGCAAVLLTKCSIEVGRADLPDEGQDEAGNRSLST